MRAEDLRARVERRGDATVVRLDGVLDVDSSPSLRAAVLACLAAEPSVIVLDVADLRHRDDIALTVLPALAQHAAAWPGSAMTLAAAPPPLASALDRMAVARAVPLFPTTDAALRATTGAGERVRVTLQPMLDATAAARHLVGRACVRWGVERVRDIAELVVTEFVSNVLRHAGTEMEVGVAHDHRLLHISVRDHAAGLPRLGGAPRPVERVLATAAVAPGSVASGSAASGSAAPGSVASGSAASGSAASGSAASGSAASGSAASGSVAPGSAASGSAASGSVAPGTAAAPAARKALEPSAEQLREDGRGLLVVSALTHAWGCTPVPDGKVVWATLRV